MKRFIILLFVFMFFPSFVDADECSYKEKRELATLASYVDYTYKYNEDKETFDVTIMNINDKIEIFYENQSIKVSNQEAIIKDIPEGTQMKIDIYSTIYNNCYNEYLRVLIVSVPYLNDFYNSSLCKGKEDLVVCNSKFIDYEISYETFIKLINRKEEEIKKEEENKIDINEEPTFIEKTIEFLSDYWLKFVTFILSSLINYSIFSTIYRKIRHRL